MSAEAIARTALARRGELVTSLRDAEDALDAALAEFATEVGVTAAARALGLSRKTTSARVNRHRRATA